MGKKSNKSKKNEKTRTTIVINSEESAIAFLENMIKIWRNRGNIEYLGTIQGLSNIPKEFRTPRVIKYILSKFSNIEAQASLFPEESLTEEVLIQTLLLNPAILSPILGEIIVEKDDALITPEEAEAEKFALSKINTVRDRVQKSKNIKPIISRDKLTMPVLVAYEIGSSRSRGINQPYNMGFGVSHSNSIDLLEMYFSYCKDEKGRKMVYQIADEVTREIKEKDLEGAFYPIDIITYNALIEKKGVDLQQISDLIQTKCKEAKKDIKGVEEKGDDVEKSEPYRVKYKKVKIKQGQKLLILIGGHSDSGKTTLSKNVAAKFLNVNYFDSDDLMDTFNPQNSSKDFWARPSEFIDPEDEVVIYSDPIITANYSDDAKDIMSAIENPNVVKIYIKPKDDCIEKMILNAKGNWKGRADRLTQEVKSQTAFFGADTDMILENDFSIDGMRRMADEVIENIMKKYPGLLSVVEYGERPDANDFAEAVGFDRIQEGAEQAEKVFGNSLLGVEADYIPE